MQVYLVGSPVLAILHGMSTNGFYIGQSLLLWTFPMSAMGLLIFPKMLLVHRQRRDASSADLESSEERRQSAQILQRVRESEELMVVDAGTQVDRDPSESITTPSPLSNGPRIQIVTFD